MNIKDYVKQFNKSYDQVKEEYGNDFNIILNEERHWLINIEDKLALLDDEDKILNVKSVIQKLKSNNDFEEVDIDSLSIFISQINSIVRIANRINNFKQGAKLNNNLALDLPSLFNQIKKTNNLKEFRVDLNSNLKTFLPHLYSIIKHCQDPVNYPIYYKYWKNITREVLEQSDDYDNICNLYRQLPSQNRHLNFGAYYGTIGYEIAKGIAHFDSNLDKNSKDYKYLTTKVLSVERYQEILNQVLDKNKSFKKNYRDLYIDWMNINSKTEKSNKLQSYVKAIEILSIILSYNIFETTDKEQLNLLYDDLIKEQRNEQGKYYHKDAPSYGSNGFYSASIKSYIKFLNTLNLNSQVKVKGKKMQNSLNQILYGPPGTGKTYKTVNKALEIIFENDDVNKEFKIIKDDETEYGVSYNTAKEDDDRLALKTIFEYYKKQGQIDFVTFHQSYGYEEFVEGIKAKTENNQVKYEVESGVFKSICERADQSKIISNIDKELQEQINDISENPTIWKISLGESGSIKKECFNDNVIRLGWDNYGDLNSNDTTQRELKDFYSSLKIGDIVLSFETQWTIDGIGIVIDDYEFDKSYSDYQHKRKVNWILKGLSINIKDYNKGVRLTLSTLYRLYRMSKNDILTMLIDNQKKEEINENKNFVLIIDEINRGNISKIFGELITLIEPSKRISEKEEVKVKLQYTHDKELFGVPNNVYILGTMNTADRSIAHIDTALRRRFDFEEMLPKSSLLVNDDGSKIEIVNNGTDTGIDIEEILKAINERIEYIYDREHMIGHSYLLPLKDNPTKDKLDEIFKNNILPLLAEYFYSDWMDIKLILNDFNSEGEDFFIIEKTTPNYILDNKRKINKVFTIQDDFKIDGYKNIYKKVNAK